MASGRRGIQQPAGVPHPRGARIGPSRLGRCPSSLEGRILAVDSSLFLEARILLAEHGPDFLDEIVFADTTTHPIFRRARALDGARLRCRRLDAPEPRAQGRSKIPAGLRRADLADPFAIHYDVPLS